MQLTVNAGELATALRILKPAVGRAAFVPILSHVLIDARDGRLTLTASNTDLTLETSILATVTKPGRTTTSAAKLADWSALQTPKAELSLSADAKNLHLAIGRNKARLGVADADDFPMASIFDGLAITLPADDFSRGLDLALPSVAKEESRPVLGGLLLKFEGTTLTLAGADSHRLGVARLTLADTIADPLSLIVPRANVVALGGLLNTGGDLTIQTNEVRTRVQFTVGETSLGSSLLDGQFPDFMRVVPVDHKATITVSAADLVMQIQSALLAHGSKALERPVRFRASADGLLVWAQTEDMEHEGVATGEHVGETVDFALNGTFTVEAIRALGSEQIVIGSSGPTGAVLMTTPDGPERECQVVMAMFIKEAQVAA